MSIKLAIFDLDGTILDTLEDLADAVNHALKVHDLPVHTLDEVRSYIGNGIRNLIDRSVPENTPADVVQSVFAEFRSHYAAHCADKTRPYPGVLEMLDTIRAAGIKTAVLSNKADFAVQELCRNYFGERIDYAAGEKEGIPKKPAPDSVYILLNAMGFTAEDTVYIGDSEVDVHTARNAGLKCLMVNWGFRTNVQLLDAGAADIFSSIRELTDALLK